MGLLGEESVQRLNMATIRRVADAASAAGIAALPSAMLAGRGVDSARLHDVLQALREALEASPVPAQEWAVLIALFSVDDLARLVGVSPASLRRYSAASRPTPDPVAERLHFIARVVADLRGAYNDVGIRRWFERRRTALRGKAPAEILIGEWDPESRSARSVRDLARSLTFSPAT
jgi:uncharacterized protein (DUF2384 family)